MIELNYNLSLEDRLKFVKKYTTSRDFDMGKSEDRKILTVLSDYLTGDLISNNKIKKVEIESETRNSIRYITPKSAKNKYQKDDVKRALQEIPQLQDYIDYRENLLKIKKKNPNFVKNCLKELREKTGEKVSTEAQFFKELSADIGCCTYPFTRFKRRTSQDLTPEKFEVDYKDRKHLMALLKNYDYLKGNLDLVVIRCDLDEILEESKLTDGEWKNMMKYMDGLPAHSELTNRAVNKMLDYIKGIENGL